MRTVKSYIIKNQQVLNIYRLRYLLNSKLGRPERKFVILGMGRNGSTLLTSLINNHPEVYTDSEIFGTYYPSKNHFPTLFLKSMERKAILNKKLIYGFKLKLGQINRESRIKDYKMFVEKLHNNGFLFIYLWRQNILRLALSLYRAQEENNYEIKLGQLYKKKKLTIDCRRLEEMISGFEWETKWEQTTFRKFPLLELTYENDLEYPEYHNKTAQKVFSFLGVNTIDVKSTFVKKASHDFKDDIENYDEFLDYYKNSKYANFLD